MRHFSKVFVLATTAIVVGASVGQAQVAPPGFIYDLHTAHPAELDAYQPFSVSFVAALTTTTISFAFRETPAFFGFDDASVTTGGGPNLLGDPGFEGAADGTNVPAGWGRWIRPVDVSAIGRVDVTPDLVGCPQFGAHSGTTFWCDGSVQGYDAIFQNISTTVGQTYTISWFMSDNSGEVPRVENPNNPVGGDINMYVYATDGIPGDVTVIAPAPPPIDTATPEPATLTLFATGLLGVASVARRRRRKNAK